MIDVSQLEKIGNGVFSKVYALDNNWVVKLSSVETDGFRVIHDLPDSIIQRYSLPIIDKSRSDSEEGLFVIEKLYPLDSDVFEGTNFAITVLNDLHECKGLKGNFKAYIHEKHYLRPIFEKAERLLCLLLRLGYPVCLDINNKNIMQRPNGELVLSDPFGYLNI